jgi:hypothetical protein
VDVLEGLEEMVRVSTSYYGRLYQTISRIHRTCIGRPSCHLPERSEARHALVAAPVFAGALIGSTFALEAARAQQANGALPPIDVTSRPMTNDVQSVPPLQQTPQIGLTGTKISVAPMSKMRFVTSAERAPAGRMRLAGLTGF